MKEKISSRYVLPVLMSFFVMSFIDLVGTGVDELKQSSETPQYVLQLIPFVAFIWFFILSVPVGIWQAKIGKKKALFYGIIITAIGLLVPILGNTLPVILFAFALLGIGNTILQVSANPLLADVAPKDKVSSFMSLSQFIKAIGSMIGPYVAAVIGPWLAVKFGNETGGEWRYGLYLFAVISIIVGLWLSSSKIVETEQEGEKASFASCIEVIKNPFVFMMVFGIFLVVGIDVAMNSNIGTYLVKKIQIGEETAKYGKTMYFFAKMLGSFLGAILLTKIAARKFLIGSSVLSIIALLSIIFVPGELIAWMIIFIIGLGVSNIFPLIFSITVAKYPSKNNEISGLMMMAISGGAIIPFVVGLAMDNILNMGIVVLVACAVYLLYLGYLAPKK